MSKNMYIIEFYECSKCFLLHLPTFFVSRGFYMFWFFGFLDGGLYDQKMCIKKEKGKVQEDRR